MIINRKPDISVIVPIYNAEEYIEESLKSLLWQKDVSVEAIIIDDGSTDDSGNIADAYAKKYPGFHCFHIENGGPGLSRNMGTEHATGKYIAFADADDIVTENAYYKMFALAEYTGADLTICNAERFVGRSRRASGLHKRVFAHYEKETHITENHDLLYDTTSWTKLISRDFYIRNRLSFEEGIIYEDIPFSLKAHILCDRCAMVNDIGYLWRIREGSNRSLTQSADLEKILSDRITALGRTKEIADTYGDEGLQRALQSKILDIDLRFFINKLNTVTDEEAYTVIDMINSYIGKETDESAFEPLYYLDKQKYKLVRARDLSGLKKLLDYKDYAKEPVTEESGRLFIELSEGSFPEKKADITEEFRKYRPQIKIDDISDEGGRLAVTSHLYWNRLSMRPGEQQVKAYLCNCDKRIELETGQCEFSGFAGKESPYCYDGAGFRFFLDPGKLPAGETLDEIFHVEIDYKNRFFEGTEVVKELPKDLRKQFGNTIISNDEASAKLVFTRTGEINLIKQ